MEKSSDEFIHKNVVMIKPNKKEENRKKHLTKRGMPRGSRRGLSRKKGPKERRLQNAQKKNVEKRLQEIVGEEVDEKWPIKPINLKELVTTLTGESPDTEFLVDLESEQSRPTTEGLINILEDDEVSLDDLCRRAKCTKEFTWSATAMGNRNNDGESFRRSSDEMKGDCCDEGVKVQNPSERLINDPNNSDDIDRSSTKFSFQKKSEKTLGPKVGNDENGDQSDSELDESLNVDEGRRSIVIFPFVLAEFHKALDDHLEKGTCKFRDIQLIEQRRSGFRTTFYIQCSQCHLIMLIDSEPRNSEFMDINHAAVSGTITTGTGHAQLTELTASMGILGPSGPQFRIYQTTLLETLITAAERCVKETGELEVKLASQRGDVHNGVPCTWVVCDGAYAKRSYITSAHNSLSGVGVIVGYHSRQVLFFGIKNVYCSICSRATKAGLEPKIHTCFKNFDGSASSMETEAILDGFKCSLDQHGLIYTHIIADGDSSVYKAIREYDPYRELLISVMKIECYNHLLRRLIFLLKAIGSDDRSLVTWRKLIEGYCLRFRTDILGAVDYRRKEPIPEKEQVENLRRDCINVPHHVFGDHEKCAKYFCNGKLKENEVNHVPMMKKLGIFQKIENAFERVVLNCDSLIKKLNNNLCESCNSLIAKTIAGKRINFTQRGSYTARVCAAVIQFNNQDVLQRIAKGMNKKPTPIVKSLERKRKAANEAKKLRRHLTRISEGAVKKKRTPKPRGKNNMRKKVQYGIDCETSDLPDSEIDRKKTILLEELSNWQKDSSTIENMTKSGSNLELEKSIAQKTIPTQHFGRICKMHASTNRNTIVKNILNPSPKSLSKNHYSREQLDKVKERLFDEVGVIMTDCGVFIDRGAAYVVASPTGLIENDGILEILYPQVARDEMPLDVIEKRIADIHKIYQNNDVMQMNKKHDWYYDIQGTLHITQRTYCIFVLATDKGIHWVGVDKEEGFWEKKMAEALRKFYHDCLIYEIIDSRLSRRMTVRNPPEVESKVIAKNLKKSLVYDNGLFQDKQYYLLHQGESSFIMSAYNCSNLAPLMGREHLLLYAADYGTCHGTRDISSDVMDCFMIIKSETTWQDAQFIPSNHTGFIVGDMSERNHGDEWLMYNLNWCFVGKVFLPYVRSGHWCLIVLDMEEQTIMHIDPMRQGKTARSDETLRRFQKYLNDCNHRRKNQLSEILWKVVYDFEKRPIQIDGYNCGIFVMYYMDCIAQGKSFDLKFDPDAYRLYLQDLLLQESQPMENFCLSCLNDQSRSETIMCVSCKRWAHKRCTNAPMSPNSNCTLCAVYFSS